MTRIRVNPELLTWARQGGAFACAVEGLHA